MEDAARSELAVYAVFAQRTDARVDIDAWGAHAERFFSTRLGLTEEKRYAPGLPPPRTDRASFVVAPTVMGRNRVGADAEPGIRTAFARPTGERDLALAAQVDRGGGLALLARRCPTLWLVESENDLDTLALRLAAIFASIFLGPILDLRRSELFGVKTARAKLAALGAG